MDKINFCWTFQPEDSEEVNGWNRKLWLTRVRVHDYNKYARNVIKLATRGLRNADRNPRVAYLCSILNRA